MTETQPFAAPAIADPTFWSPDVLPNITMRVALDPRVVNWASLADAKEIKRLGFNSDAKYTLPQQRNICQKLQEVADAVDENGYLDSVYSQKGKPFDFYAESGRVADLNGCLRAMFMHQFRELDVSSAQHRIHEVLTKLFLPKKWEMARLFFRDLKDPRRLRQQLATELNLTTEVAKEHLNSIWNSFEERKGVNHEEFRTSERTAWSIRQQMMHVPQLKFILDIVSEEHRNDTKRIPGSFMSRVYAFVIARVMLKVRERLGSQAIVSLIHDSCHVDSQESDEAILKDAEAASSAVIGDPLKWQIKAPDFRLKISGTCMFTEVDISERVSLDEYSEDALEPVEFVSTEDYVDPQQVAIDLGHSLTRLWCAKMKAWKRNELVQEVTEKSLRALNVRYKLVDDCYIDTQIDHPKQGFKMIALSKFRATLKCASVEYYVGAKQAKHKFNLVSQFEEWNRQERFERLCFHPTNTPPRHFNTWTPFDAAQMVPLRPEQRGDIAHRLVRLFQHMKHLSGERPYDFMMLVLWVANMLQHPEAKSLCLVLLSAEGVGKSMFTRLLQKIIGKTKTLRTSSPENNVWGKFNALMIGKFLVELAEISKANMHHQYEKVLNILEDESFPVECKGVDGFELDSLHHFILNSNNKSAVPPGRRWLVMSCSDKYAANIDCRQCAKRMIDTNGEELMCEACVDLGGYHAENYKAFDDLCAKSLFEFCMALDDVPEKLTSTHVRENAATAHIKQAAKDSVDAFLEDWVSNEFAEYFKEGAEGLPGIKYVPPATLHQAYRTFVEGEREVLDLPAFQSRIGRKKITSMPKKRVRIEGSTLLPYRYVVDIRKLIAELNISGETCGKKGAYEERVELEDDLSSKQRHRDYLKQQLEGKLLTKEQTAMLQAAEAQIAGCNAKLEELKRTWDQRIAAEVVQDESVDAGNAVPKCWREFYDNIEGRVNSFLDNLFDSKVETEHDTASGATDLPTVPSATEEPARRSAPQAMDEGNGTAKRKANDSLSKIGFAPLAPRKASKRH